MGDRPTRFYLIWDEGDQDTTVPAFEEVDAIDAAQARRRAKAVSRDKGLAVQIFERTGIEDVTPAGDPPGLIWDYSERFVDDVTDEEGRT